MDDDFDNGMGLPDDEIGVSIDDIAEAGPGGIESEVEAVVVPGGTRSSGGARAQTARAPKAAASAKKSSKPKAAMKKKKPAKKAAKKKAKAAKKPARKAARKAGKKAAKRKK